MDAQGTVAGAQPDRGRRRGRRLPGEHRPDAGQGHRARRCARKPVDAHPGADPRPRRLRRLAGRRPGHPDRRPGQHRRAPTWRSGQQLFIADCAQCHNFVGAGGALTYGKFAPPLTQSTPTADLRGHADRPGGHAGVQQHHDHPAAEAGHHRLRHRRPAPSRTPAASAWAASGRSPRAWSAFLGVLAVHWCSLATVDHDEATGSHELRLQQLARDEPRAGRRETARRVAGPAPGDRHAAAGRGTDPARAATGAAPSPAPPANCPPSRQPGQAPRRAETRRRRRASCSRCWRASASSPPTSACEVHSVDATLRSNLALGTSMAVAFLALGVGATIWVRHADADVELTESAQAAAPPPRQTGRRSPRRSTRAPRPASSSSGRCCGAR